MFIWDARVHVHMQSECELYATSQDGTSVSCTHDRFHSFSLVAETESHLARVSSAARVSAELSCMDLCIEIRINNCEHTCNSCICDTIVGLACEGCCRGSACMHVDVCEHRGMQMGMHLLLCACKTCSVSAHTCGKNATRDVHVVAFAYAMR